MVQPAPSHILPEKLDKVWELWASDAAVDHRVWKMFAPHALRVTTLSLVLARELRAEIKPLHVAGLAHDIGKAGLAPEILLKPEKLNLVEWSFVQAHCQMGNWVCRELLDAPKAAVYVRDHHERWDGNGYPHRLKGIEISLGGRILAVADVFDTLTHEDRPYQDREWTTNEAITELQDYAGSQFDPEVVEALSDFVGAFPELSDPEWLEEEAMSYLNDPDPLRRRFKLWNNTA